MGTKRGSWQISNRVPSRVATTRPKREKSTRVSYQSATTVDVTITGGVDMENVVTVARWDMSRKHVGKVLNMEIEVKMVTEIAEEITTTTTIKAGMVTIKAVAKHVLIAVMWGISGSIALRTLRHVDENSTAGIESKRGYRYVS